MNESEGGCNLRLQLRDNLILMMLLTASSIVVYGIQYVVFGRGEDTFFYLFQDLAFVPVQVLIVTLVINRFVNLMEKRKKIKKVNVIISTFFSETGTNLMQALGQFNRNHAALCDVIQIDALKREKKGQYSRNCAQLVKSVTYELYADPARLDTLAAIMDENKSKLLSMLENSNLLEHDSFTDMLWAVFHVADELKIRGDLTALDQSDIDHLSNDLLRAYSALVAQWVQYIVYLKEEYPFLYAAAIRKNPFQPGTSGVIN
jgi:hypothetical protein